MRTVAGRLLWWILNYRPGPAFWIAGLLSLFLGMAVFTQYQMTGTVDLARMVNQNSDRKEFWDRNPDVEHTDSYPNTSLVVVRDRQSGVIAMLDMLVVQAARIRPVSCQEPASLSTDSPYPGATSVVCYAIDKPDTGAGDPFTYAKAWTARGKQSQIGQFYRDQFSARGMSVTRIQDSSRAVILEAEDAHHDTVARVSIRSSFDTAQVFLAVTDGFAPHQRSN